MLELALVLVMGLIPLPSGSAADLVQCLRAKDQALLDAIAPGDVKTWDEALASNAVYVDENGEEMDRAQCLAQLQPLPKGASGTIRISKYSAQFSGDVATVVHTDDETEIFHGQNLKAQYLMTETWQRQGRSWKLLQVHATAVLQEPKSVKLPEAQLNEYTGRYSAAPDLNYIIRREGDHLIGQVEGRSQTPLVAEVRDIFFVSARLRTRKIFQRDDSGKIIGFVDRREGEDLVWKRVP
jgi:hypothetical protein